MANSLRDQLLKAGLVTQEQLEQANQPKPKPSNPIKQPKSKPAAARASAPKSAPKPPKRVEKSDLAQFYQERDAMERTEKLEAERKQREIAARRKEVRAAVQALINENVQNIDDAEIRYNFVVGDNIKYVYVTETQQTALASGDLAITFLEGKRCLIPASIAQQIQALDPEKIVIFNIASDDDTTNSDSV